MHAEDLVRDNHWPVIQRRFFEKHYSVQSRRYPIARGQHVACNLGHHCIHVVHLRWRGHNATKIDRSRDEQNYEVWNPVLACEDALHVLNSVIWILHSFTKRKERKPSQQRRLTTIVIRAV